MDISGSDFSLNQKLNEVDMFKTRMEVDNFNKSIKTDGKENVKNLGKDEFLKLLITELSHQDPTNPMQDREFISQMAQFSSLEQMLNMNTNLGKFLNDLKFQSSYDLLGKNVEIQMQDKVDENGMMKTVKGVVDSIAKNGNETVVSVNGEMYPIAGIVKVAND
jgi:flagellar basal-body rod modification protein FlgD